MPGSSSNTTSPSRISADSHEGLMRKCLPIRIGLKKPSTQSPNPLLSPKSHYPVPPNLESAVAVHKCPDQASLAFRPARHPPKNSPLPQKFRSVLLLQKHDNPKFPILYNYVAVQDLPPRHQNTLIHKKDRQQLLLLQMKLLPLLHANPLFMLLFSCPSHREGFL